MRSFLIVALLLLASAGGNVWQYLRGVRLAGDFIERYANAEREFTGRYTQLGDELNAERRTLASERRLACEAASIVDGLKITIGRNAGSVREAKSIIAEIRAAVEKLEAVCANRPADNGGD
jgi:hypothetical protein